MLVVILILVIINLLFYSIGFAIGYEALENMKGGLKDVFSDREDTKRLL